MLTLWNWKQEQTVLRSKAFSQDVFRVSFSTELEGQLTSSGTGHIRYELRVWRTYIPIIVDYICKIAVAVTW